MVFVAAAFVNGGGSLDGHLRAADVCRWDFGRIRRIIHWEKRWFPAFTQHTLAPPLAYMDTYESTRISIYYVYRVIYVHQSNRVRILRGAKSMGRPSTSVPARCSPFGQQNDGNMVCNDTWHTGRDWSVDASRPAGVERKNEFQRIHSWRYATTSLLVLVPVDDNVLRRRPKISTDASLQGVGVLAPPQLPQDRRFPASMEVPAQCDDDVVVVAVDVEVVVVPVPVLVPVPVDRIPVATVFELAGEVSTVRACRSRRSIRCRSRSYLSSGRSPSSSWVHVEVVVGGCCCWTLSTLEDSLSGGSGCGCGCRGDSWTDCPRDRGKNLGGDSE